MFADEPKEGDELFHLVAPINWTEYEAAERRAKERGARLFVLTGSATVESLNRSSASRERERLKRARSRSRAKARVG